MGYYVAMMWLTVFYVGWITFSGEDPQEWNWEMRHVIYEEQKLLHKIQFGVFIILVVVWILVVRYC
jgi:hypothetical protein